MLVCPLSQPQVTFSHNVDSVLNVNGSKAPVKVCRLYYLERYREMQGFGLSWVGLLNGYEWMKMEKCNGLAVLNR